MSKIELALKVAFEAHEGQVRKISKLPFIVHPLEVMQFLIDENASEEVIIAGILHDTLEDTTYTADEIEKEFGKKVKKLVEFCTEKENLEQDSEEEKRKSWKVRKQKIIDNCKTADYDELLIELADKLSNLHSMETDLQKEDIWQYFHASKEDIKWYYTTLNSIFEDKLTTTNMYAQYKKSLKKVFN